MKSIQLFFWLFSISIFSADAYRIEISNNTIANTHLFLASYYGNQVFVIDSTMTDAFGKAVFEREYELCTGIFTLVAPGKLMYDLLLENHQQLRVEWTATNEIIIDGDKPAAAYAAYQAWLETTLPDKEQLAAHQRQIINNFPDTFLAAYLTALQPLEYPVPVITDDMNQMMHEYRFRRQNFFAKMPLSDVRMLRTPLYHENLHYYLTQFVTQQTDSLIHIAYRMLEQASDSYETFFYVSDFLLDFCYRNRNMKDINQLFNFVRRNRDMLGTRGMAMLPARSSANFFAIKNEKLLENKLKNMTLNDTEGNPFYFQTVNSKYRVIYFWKNDCTQCIADAARWQTMLNRNSRSCVGIAVNIQNDVSKPENRILAYEPLCVNISTGVIPLCETGFFATNYSKIIITDAEGCILGLFASIASLENFLKIAK